MKLAPEPKDVQEFLFKQSHIQQICDAFTSVPIACSLIAGDGKRGLLYVGNSCKLTVLKAGSETGSPSRYEHTLSAPVTRIALNCDCSYLAVSLTRPAVIIYNTNCLLKNNLTPLYEVQLSSSREDVSVYDLRWNPCVPTALCTVTSDHTLGSYSISSLTSDANAPRRITVVGTLGGQGVLCSSWSPKGKQIVTGCGNGNIIQFKPDLSVARTIAGPNPTIGEVVAILWISNYQFCAAYRDSSALTVNVLIIDAPKGETNAVFTSYEDITYGMSLAEREDTHLRYYFDHIPEWGLIIAGSSGSCEIAVLGTPNNGATWEQWQPVDSGRAQLPLVGKSESFVVGMCVDRSPTQNLPWGADNTLPNSVPILHIFGTSGQLCSFHMINLKPDCPAICTPPTEIISIPDQLRPSVVPSEISFNLNNGATSTPRPKATQVIQDKQMINKQTPQNVPATNLFSGLPKSTVTIPQTETKKPSVPQQDRVEIIMKPESKIVQSEEVIIPEKNAFDETLCLQHFCEERILFEHEMEGRRELQASEIISEYERKQLGEKCAIVEEFLRELKEITSSLSSDVACLKALLLQSFAWLEETKSNSSVNAADGTRNRSDGGNAAKLQRLLYFTQAQRVQATKVLDLEQTEHNCQVGPKMKIPSLEFIYQSLLRHTEIIAKEKSIILQLSKRRKSLPHGNSISSLNRSVSNLSLSGSLSTINTINTGGAVEQRYREIANKTISFTRTKQNRLRNLLLQATPKTIKAVNPSPVQIKVKQVLSSLATLSSPSAESKSKQQRKPAIVWNPAEDKTKMQSPLASLNSIVARIGPTNSNEGTMQSKTLSKSGPISSVFSSTLATSTPRPESKENNASSSTLPQSKPKQNIVPFAPSNEPPRVSGNLPKSFGNVTSTPLGSLLQKSDLPSHIVHKENVAAKEVESKPAVISTKVDSVLFGNTTLKNLPHPELSPNAIAPQNTVNATVTPPAERQTAFSFTAPTQIIYPPNLAVTKPTPPHTITMNQKPEATQPAVSTFSFASKPVNNTATLPLSSKTQPLAAQTPAQESLDLTVLSFGLQGNSKSDHASSTTNTKTTTVIPFGSSSSSNFNKPLPPVAGSVFGPSFSTPATTSSVSTPETISGKAISPPSSIPIFDKVNATPSSAASFDEVNAVPTAGPTFDAPSASPKPPIFGVTSATSVPASVFGKVSNGITTAPFGATSTTASTIPTLGTSTAKSSGPSTFGTAPVSTSASAFGAISASLTPSAAATVAASSVASTFNSTSTFAGTQNTSATSVFGSTPTSIVSTTSAFSASPTATAKPAFGGTTTPAAPSFGGVLNASQTTPSFGATVTSPSSITSAFGKTAIGSPATGFGTTANAASPGSIFGGVSAAGSSTTPFGGTGGSFNASIFGNVPTLTSSIFGGSSANTAFGSGSSTTIPGFSSSGSIFGGTSTGGSSIFGGGSSTGQQAAFGAKPVFGSPTPVFGESKSVFGGGFGANTFGANATPSFGTLPAMGINPSTLGAGSMQKVFGSPTGSSTFESLADQSGALTFGSLAQTSSESQKPPPFSEGSSFQSWR